VTVQERPPANDKVPSESMGADRWTTEGIAETLPGILPPLRWCVAGPLLEEALRRLLADLGAEPPIALDHPILSLRDGRAVLSVDAVDALAAATPTAGHSGWHRARHDLRLVRLRRINSAAAESCIVAADEVVSARTDLGAKPDGELLAYRRRLLDLAGRTASAEAGVAVAASAAYQHFERALVARLGDDAGRDWARRTTSGHITTATDWLRELAAQLAPGGHAVLDRSHGDVQELVRSAARRAGSRAVFAGPTWDEDLETVWPVLLHELQDGTVPAYVSGLTELGPGRDPIWQGLVGELRALPGWARTRVLTGQVVDVRLHLLARLREDAVVLLDRRERTKQAFLSLGGEVRRVHLELGRRLAARGALTRPDDVELLDEREVVAALAGVRPDPLDIDRRRLNLTTLATVTVNAATAGPSGAERFQGTAAAPGRCRGLARVLTTVDDADLVEPGDIIVARTTDPSWTPLLMLAGAIVVEEGGMLSHAGVLARELHIPAVLGIPGVVERLRAHGEGIDVEVDGGAGCVTVFDADAKGADHGR
jgi:phosphohistidine swiveling domain-containing protein